jgi:ABC-type sugar transport system permease subunit
MAPRIARLPRSALTSWWEANQRRVIPYVFIAPFYLLFLVFIVFSVMYSFRLSLYRGAGFTDLDFNGFGNYTRLFGDARYLQALRNTTLFALASLFILTPLSLLLALAWQSKHVPQGLRGLYRLSFFLPFITSTVVISILFSLVFDQKYGLVNNLLASGGITGPGWLTATAWALPAMILINIWTYVGVNALFWMAGLSAIPPDLYEAAQIDGAGTLARFWNVTVPLLRPITLFMVIQAIVGSYNWFATSYLLTNGGPSDATLSLQLYIYQESFVYDQFGYANAIAYSMVLLVFVLSLIQIILFRGSASSEA